MKWQRKIFWRILKARKKPSMHPIAVARVADMSIDRFSADPGGELNDPMNPLTGNIASLTTLTLNADISGPEPEFSGRRIRPPAGWRGGRTEPKAGIFC